MGRDSNGSEKTGIMWVISWRISSTEEVSLCRLIFHMKDSSRTTLFTDKDNYL